MKFLNFGSLNRDIVYSVPHTVTPGETLASTRQEVFCGGKGLNQSLALARAGAPVYHAGCIGGDGAALRRMLEESGVNTEFLRTLEGPSGHAVIQVDPKGQNSIILFGGANQQIDRPMAEEVLSAFGAGDHLVLQNEISEIPYIIERAAARGMRVILNPSPFPENWREWPMEAVSFFVVNEIEGALLTGEEEPERILAAMRRQFPAARTLLTLGSRGAAFDDGETVYFAGCVDVPVADTTGAGDTFLGYFFSGLEQRGAERALHLASAAAALAVSVKGAANSIPALEQTLAFAAARGLTV